MRKLELEEQRRQKEKEMDEARQIHESMMISEEHEREEAEKAKMTLRPRTRSTSTYTSSYRTSDEDTNSESEVKEVEEMEAEFSTPGREIVDPPTEEEGEDMDITEVPKINILSNNKIHIEGVPLLVRTQKGIDVTKTIKTVIRFNGPRLNLENFLKNLHVTLTRAEDGIEKDEATGQLEVPKNAHIRHIRLMMKIYVSSNN